jgi:hypothetical protein
MTEDIELELNEIEHNGLILLMKIIRDEEKWRLNNLTFGKKNSLIKSIKMIFTFLVQI